MVLPLLDFARMFPLNGTDTWAEFPIQLVGRLPHQLRSSPHQLCALPHQILGDWVVFGL